MNFTTATSTKRATNLLGNLILKVALSSPTFVPAICTDPFNFPSAKLDVNRLNSF